MHFKTDLNHFVAALIMYCHFVDVRYVFIIIHNHISPGVTDLQSVNAT